MVAALAASAAGVQLERAMSVDRDGAPDRPPAPAADRTDRLPIGTRSAMLRPSTIAALRSGLGGKPPAGVQPVLLTSSAQISDYGHWPAAARAPPAAMPPRRRRASYELAAPHSITSSARASRGIGNLSPSALAVLMLMIISIWVACCTGSSAVFSPLRIRPAYTPIWRLSASAPVSVAHQAAGRRELAKLEYRRNLMSQASAATGDYWPMKNASMPTTIPPARTSFRPVECVFDLPVGAGVHDVQVDSQLAAAQPAAFVSVSPTAVGRVDDQGDESSRWG